MSRKNDRVTRRDFLAASAAIGAGAALTGLLGTAEAAQGNRKLPTVKLGKTGKTVSILGFGGGVNVTPPLFNASLKEGITYIDTAQGYGKGNSEINIGKILDANGRRKDCFIVTKSGRHEPEKFASRLTGSLESLRTDYVDLYCLHNLGDPDQLNAELKAAVERLKKEKKIRFFGFSCHHARLVEVMERAAEVGFVDAMMIKYNFRDYGNDELNRALDKCTKAGIGLVAMKTQGGAVSFEDRVDPFVEKGFNQHQAALKAVWEDGRIHSIVSAMKNIKQVQENTAAARNKKMGAVERERLQQYAAETSHLYCRGCGQHCEGCVDAPLHIADTLRYRMYYEYYGESQEARRLFRELPSGAKRIANVDFSAAESACPYNLPVGELMRDAAAKLA